MSRKKKSDIDGMEVAMFIHDVIIAVSLIISIVCFYGIVKLIDHVNKRYPDKKIVTILFAIFLISIYIYGVYLLFIHVMT